jgi:uncharacterized membrane protein (UPF0127 family)
MMTNPSLSLDLVFIGADGLLVQVEPDATPLSLDPIASTAPVTGVLELLAGTAGRMGLTKGDRVTHRAFTGTANQDQEP